MKGFEGGGGSLWGRVTFWLFSVLRKNFLYHWQAQCAFFSWILFLLVRNRKSHNLIHSSSLKKSYWLILGSKNDFGFLIIVLFQNHEKEQIKKISSTETLSSNNVGEQPKTSQKAATVKVTVKSNQKHKCSKCGKFIIIFIKAIGLHF